MFVSWACWFIVDPILRPSIRSSPTTAHKRLDKIETFLTPKDWAIRLVDEMRSYPSACDHVKELVKLPFNELPDQRAFLALKEQAGERHPGRKPEDIHVRQR